MIVSIIIKPTTQLETSSLSKISDSACAQSSAGLGGISAWIHQVDSLVHLSLVFLRPRNAFKFQLCSTWGVSTSALKTQEKHEKNEYTMKNNRSLRILKPVSKITLWCFNHDDSCNWPFILTSFNCETSMQIYANSIAMQIIHCIWRSSPANFKVGSEFWKKVPEMYWETMSRVPSLHCQHGPCDRLLESFHEHVLRASEGSECFPSVPSEPSGFRSEPDLWICLRSKRGSPERQGKLWLLSMLIFMCFLKLRIP